MTRDEVIKMAMETGTPVVSKYTPGMTSFEFDYYLLQRLAELVAAAEREECAKVCDEVAETGGDADECATEIRARKGGA